MIVVDGIPGGNLDLLQQDDIASIDVLKDGSQLQFTHPGQLAG